MTMHDDEIDRNIAILTEHAPQFAKYAKFLADWRDTVNQSSDGWGVWKPGTQAANTLMAHLKAVETDIRGIGTYSPNPKPLPADADFRKALKPIRDAAARFKLSPPALLEDAQKPTAKAAAPVIPLDADAFVTVAERHGEESEPEHEVGDLQTFFLSAYDLLPP